MHRHCLSLLAFLCLAAVAAAAIIPGGLFNLDQEFFKADTIKECGTLTDLLHIEYIRIKPDPPVKGESLDIAFKGTLDEEVTKGSVVDVTVKYGAIRLLQKTYDLCEQAKQVNKTCPIEKGGHSILHTVDLPKDIPPGKYTILAKVHTADNRQITCLTAVVIFRP